MRVRYTGTSMADNNWQSRINNYNIDFLFVENNVLPVYVFIHRWLFVHTYIM